MQVLHDVCVNEAWVKCIRSNMPHSCADVLLSEEYCFWNGSCLYRCDSEGISCWYVVCTNRFRHPVIYLCDIQALELCKYLFPI